jgi:formate dehydrogenase iron-sulfur subunit
LAVPTPVGQLLHGFPSPRKRPKRVWALASPDPVLFSQIAPPKISYTVPKSVPLKRTPSSYIPPEWKFRLGATGVTFMSKAILYDATLCIGCKQCEGACAQQNKLPYDDTVAAESVQSAHKYTVVLSKEDKFMRRLCMHCEKPACASVCPVGAFHKTAAGPVVYDVWKCIGCRYCMVACVFAQPKYEWQSLNPRVRKCIMCPDRIAAGKQTACAEICPTGATKFGERDDLIAEAKERLRQNPSNYVNRIYGLNEVGGTSVFVLASQNVEEYGYPASAKIGDTPMPEYTGRVMERIPDFIPVWTLVLGGIYWVSHRRDEVAEAEAEEKKLNGSER